MTRRGCIWFVCGMDCCVWLDLLIIWVWEPLSSIALIRPFSEALKRHGFTIKPRALWFQKDGRTCSFHITNRLVEHQGSISAGYALSMVNANRSMRIIQRPCDDLEPVTELPCPCTWFMFHVVDLLVQPTQGILVRQPIFLHQRVRFARDGTPSMPARSGRCNRGCISCLTPVFFPFAFFPCCTTVLVAGGGTSEGAFPPFPFFPCGNAPLEASGGAKRSTS